MGWAQKKDMFEKYGFDISRIPGVHLSFVSLRLGFNYSRRVQETLGKTMITNILFLRPSHKLSPPVSTNRTSAIGYEPGMFCDGFLLQGWASRCSLLGLAAHMLLLFITPLFLTIADSRSGENMDM